MPLSFVWKLTYILLVSLYSFALDINDFLDPLDGLDATPPISFATAENGIAGNLVAASNIPLTGEPVTDLQGSDLFNIQTNPDTLVQLSEGDSTACESRTEMSPNRRRRGKREKQSCDSNLFVAPGAGKKPTVPTGFQEHESGQQPTDGSSEGAPGKKPSPAQDGEKEPSADTKAGPNNELPCNDEEFKHALCGPMSASWQLRRVNTRTLFMLGAANTCMLLGSAYFPSYPPSRKIGRFYSNWSSIRTLTYRCSGFPPGCLEPDLAWCCKSVAPVSLIRSPISNRGNPTTVSESPMSSTR